MSNFGSGSDPGAFAGFAPQYLQSNGQVQTEFSYLINALNELTTKVKSKIAEIRSKRSAMSIGDMFDLQMAMNKLSQFSEMSTSVISAMNTAIGSIARNVK